VALLRLQPAGVGVVIDDGADGSVMAVCQHGGSVNLCWVKFCNGVCARTHF
jgi:hypothetical protein